MRPALDLGGVLSIRCPTCGEERGNECRTKPGSRGGFHTTTPHAARVKAAPPIVEAHVGDLVLVRYRGEHVAQLVDIGDPGRAALSVRFWRPSAHVFAAPRLLEREAVIGLAPDDARTALAREELRLEDRRKFIDEPVGVGGTHLRSRLRTSDDPPALAPGMVGVFTINGSKLADVTNIEIVEGAHRFAVAPDIAEGRGPFDPGQDTSDPSPTTPDAPPDPWFTSDSAPTKAPPKGW